jgi:hypothetical protein
MFSIIRLIVALLTFSIGISFVLIFNAFRQTDDVTNFQVPEVPSATFHLPSPPEFINSVESTPKFIFDYDPTKFHPRGDYYILGKKPKEFSEFEVFELAAYEWIGMTSIDKASGNAIIVTNSNGTENIYYTVTGSVTKERLTFIATPEFEKDFEYRFDGQFLKGGQISKASKSQAVVKGKLTKLKNGVKIAESKVKFRVEYLGC